MIIIEGFETAKLALSRQVSTEFYEPPSELQHGFKDAAGADIALETAVRQIIDEVRRRGDAALLDYELRFDGVELVSLEVSRAQVTKAYKEVAPELVEALKMAAERIRIFHSAQNESLIGVGTKRSPDQLIRPLERVGVYAPGGTAAYPSTVLMTAIPAKVAGVKEVLLATPPKAGGVVPPAVLVAADIAGVDRIFCIGGAQAIAALAFGTETIHKVDKICGPGNIFVVWAKKLVYGVVDIDGLQGPTEVMVIADGKANPGYCAADLLAQAEHDPLASATLITTSRSLAEEVNRDVTRQLASLERREIAAESLENRGTIAVVGSIEEAIRLANLYAPEHLSLMVDKAASYVPSVVNAGCVFVGEWAAVPIGDFVAGPSHVLPTGGTARFGSPLNVFDLSLIHI